MRETLISEIKPVVRQQEATLLQSLVVAPNPSSRASEELHQQAEEHQQANNEAEYRPGPGLDPLTTPRFSRAAVPVQPLWGILYKPSFVAAAQSSRFN